MMLSPSLNSNMSRKTNHAVGLVAKEPGGKSAQDLFGQMSNTPAPSTEKPKVQVRRG